MRASLLVVAFLFAPAVARAQQPPQPEPTPPAPAATARPQRQLLEVATLRTMRDLGLITEAEYASAMADLRDSVGERASEVNSLVVGRWSTSIYGFAEADYILDSTESFNDLAGGAQVARPEGHPPPPPAAQTTYAGQHGRLQFGVRNSRIGLRMRAPESHGVRVSGTVEMDFLGYTPQPFNGTSEAGFFTSPTLRARHAYLKIETPIVDVIAGQYWELFGFQPFYHPSTVEIQGVPGQLYSRTPQLRVSKALPIGDALSLDLAVAILRPPQRDSQTPEGQGGARLAFKGWEGAQTMGATGTATMPLSIGVSGDVRRVSLPEFTQVPSASAEKTMGAVAIDAFVPILPASKERRGHTLSFNGEIVTGAGIADLYTGMTGGIAFPSIANRTGMNPPPVYPQNIDNGMVIFDTGGALHAIEYTTYLVGLQYYFPGGDVWVSANYSHVVSPNVTQFVRYAPLANPLESNYVSAAQVRESEDWYDANIFVEIQPGARVGLEYALFDDRYADAVHAKNHRVQLSGFFLF